MAWEKDIGQSIQQQQWKEMTSSWHTSVREVQTQFTNYKILNRSYWTPSRMARLKLRDDDMCWCCHKEVGTMLHMLYNCDMVKDLWGKIESFINELFNISQIKSPALCMLGIIPEELRIHGLNRQWCRRRRVC